MNLDFKEQKAFISGSTSGIGFAIAQSLAILGCDFADTSQIDGLATALGSVDILVNNVGIYTDQDFFDTSDES